MTILPHDELRVKLNHVMEAVQWRVFNADLAFRAAKSLRDAGQDGHERNVKAGWWTDMSTGQKLKRNVGELLMLAVSELGEVPPFPEVLSVMDDKLPMRPMHHVEIADCVIRLLDLLGGLDVQVVGVFERVVEDYFVNARVYEKFESVDVDLMRVVRNLSEALEGSRKGKVQVGGLFDHCKVFDVAINRAIFNLFCISSKFDLVQIIIEKMRFNASREDHKIENRLKEGGKKF